MSAVIIPMASNAQLINIEKKQPAQRLMFGNVTQQDAQKQKTQENTDTIDDEEKKVEEQLDEQLPPPTTITPEEIIEFETESKKNIRRKIKNKDEENRAQLIGVMNWSEKKLKIQELMVGGMSYEDAKKVADESLKLPKINIKNGKEIEKYIYEKGKFISNEK
jgi:hypothetical protein